MKIESYLYEYFGKQRPAPFVQDNLMFPKLNNAIKSAVEDAQWLAIHGQIMSGKTTAVEQALTEVNKTYRNKVRIVNLYWPERSGINISEVLNQIIYTLGDEFIGSNKTRRGKELRMYQVLDILTSAKLDNIKVVLVIDEAHELHLNTLKALKRLWEYKFRGQSDLLTIVLVGQESLEIKVHSDKEIRKRIIQIPFNYAQGALANVAKHIGAGLVKNELASRLSGSFAQVGDIIHAIRQAMVAAETIGTEQLMDSAISWPNEKPLPHKRGSKVEVNTGVLDKIEGKLGIGYRKDGTNG